ncbi:MAG: MaoC family dehydratase N-terminal domain-containing protein [Gammaproteobacteria bacterium]
MPDPSYGKITDERVAALRSRLGLDLDPANYLPVSEEERRNWRPEALGFNVEVSIDTSRHFVRGYGDTNPLHCDPEYAAKTRWGTLIASPMLFWTFDGDLEPRGTLKPEIAAKLKGDPLRGVGSLQADVRYDFYRPMKLGDRIYRRDAKTGIADKRSSWGGRAVHETTSFVTYNQNKEVVTVMRGMWIRGERRPVSEVKEPQPIPEPYTDDQLAEIDACYAAELSTRRGANPRYFEDVTVGESLPRLVKGPIRVTDLILFHAGFGQSFPTYAHRIAYETRKSTPGLYTRNKLNVWDIVQRMHWEEDWAHKVGAGTVYDYGAIRETFLAHLITNWTGDDGWLRRLKVQHRKFNFAGDTNWLLGKVTKKEMTAEGAEVHMEVRIENQRGLEITGGEAVVLLPSREKGPVVLPRPPSEDVLGVLRHEVEDLRRINGG